MVVGVVFFASMVTSVALWIIALYGACVRRDLKEQRLLWILLLVVAAPVGVIAYFFVEGRKKLGILALSALILLVILLPAFAIVGYLGTRLHEASLSSEPLPQQIQGL